MPNLNFEIKLVDYDYSLPEERIAQFPLAQRDQSKLLVYQQGQTEHQHFQDLPHFLPEETLLVFNNTRVIPARLHFRRDTGAWIEIFLMKPHEPGLVPQALASQEACVWQCLVGNRKRWKAGEVLTQTVETENEVLAIKAEWIDREAQLVRLSWDQPAYRWIDILELWGKLPLPPYLKRELQAEDWEQYQTIYSQEKGAVAAPTAGLHFTPLVLEKLRQKNILTDFLTLHVGGGTFQPIKNEDVQTHTMHSEQMIFSLENVENLLNRAGKIVSVGTTSLRALESLYWFGVKLANHLPSQSLPFFIEKLYPYQKDTPQELSWSQSLENIYQYMKHHQIQALRGETEIFMFPGYQFRSSQALVTNFHLPKSTLILLIAAFIGQDWRRVYEEALAQEYRFLSYGDSSLLIPGKL